MTTVYVVTDWKEDLGRIVGIFSTRENADAFIGGNDNCAVDEYALDNTGDEVYMQVVTRAVALGGGVLSKWDSGPSWELRPAAWNGDVFVNDGPGDKMVFAKSPKSPGHALELAHEARQKWVHEHALEMARLGITE